MKLTALICGTAISIAIIGTAWAAPPLLLPGGATVTPNGAPKSFQGYYEQTSKVSGEFPPKLSGGCTGTNSCTWAFKPVPSNKQLLVTQVSCLTTVSTGNPIGAVLSDVVSGTFGSTSQTLLPPTIQSIFLSLNSSTLHLFDAGERPVVQVAVDTGADWNANGLCTIAGMIFNKP